jgi:TDG/mug DNA glycosylase family protein
LTRGSRTPSQSPKPPESAVPDVLDTDLRVVFCGINPGRVSAAAGAHFANSRNDFWRLLHAAGFTSRLYQPHDQHDVLSEGIGLTNAASRTTAGSSDLRRADFAGAAARLARLAADLRPAWLAFVGKEAYRGAFGERADFGEQSRRLRDTRLFVLPSTSPANATVPWEERLRWFAELERSSRPIPRPGVRALTIDGDNRVLLFRYPTTADVGVWVCPGGAVEDGETDDGALHRELAEELHLADVDVGPWIWRRRHVRAWAGTVYDTVERIALVRVDAAAVSPDPSAALFIGAVKHGFEHRWWTLGELEATHDSLSPRSLPALMRRLLEHGPPAEITDVELPAARLPDQTAELS